MSCMDACGQKQDLVVSTERGSQYGHQNIFVLFLRTPEKDPNRWKPPFIFRYPCKGYEGGSFHPCTCVHDLGNARRCHV